MVEFNEEWYKNLFNNSNEKELISSKIAELHSIKNHKKFLEIGMGSAPFFANKLCGYFEEYWIIERQKWNGLLPNNVKFVQSDFENHIFENKFDGILLSHVIYYFLNLEKAIHKTLAMLEENGCVYFVVNGKDGNYGPLKHAFTEITNTPLVFTYDLLKNLLVNKFDFEEHSLPTKVFFDSYEKLYESMKLFFDLFPTEFENYKSEIISWLRKNIKKSEFRMNQKIFIISNP
jgi:SAM-dependent methyltransferase